MKKIFSKMKKVLSKDEEKSYTSNYFKIRESTENKLGFKTYDCVACPWMEELTKSTVEKVAKTMKCYICGAASVHCVFPYTGSTRSDLFVIDDKYWGTCKTCDKYGYYYTERTDLTKCFCEECGKFVNGVTDEKCPLGHSIWSSELFSLTRWSTTKHKFFPQAFKDAVKVILILSLKDSKNKPRHPETYLYLLPKPILFIVIEFLATTLHFELNRKYIANFVKDIRMVGPSQKVIEYWRTVKVNNQAWADS